jgi:hypothetical protein
LNRKGQAAKGSMMTLAYLLLVTYFMLSLLSCGSLGIRATLLALTEALLLFSVESSKRTE